MEAKSIDAAEPPDSEREEIEDGEGATFAGKCTKKRTYSTWEEILFIKKTDAISREVIDARILEAATNQLRPFIPAEFLPSVKKLPTDLYYWKKKDFYITQGGMKTTNYHCFLSGRCGCPSMLRVIETEENITVEVKFPHNEDSHSEDHSRGLGFLHRHNIVSQIQADPTQSSRSIAQIGRAHV